MSFFFAGVVVVDFLIVIIYFFPFEFAGICLSYRPLDGDVY